MNRALYILLVVLSFNLNAQPPSKWYNKFGGSGIDIGYGVKETYERNYIVAGSTSSFGYGATDAYLILVDSMGQKVWDKTYGGIMADVAKAVVVNPVDSGFIFTGYTGSIGNGGYDVYLARTNKNGTLIWQKSFGGLDWDFGNDIVMGPDGNVVICGYTYNSKYGQKDGYILKVNSSSGALIWEKKYGGAKDDEFKALKITTLNTIILTGETKSYNDPIGDIYFLKTTINGDSIVSKTHGRINKEDKGNSIIEDFSFTGYIIGGGTESYSSWGKDAFIFSVSSVGDSVWLQRYGNNNVDQEAIDVILNVSNTGTYVISYSDIDFVVFKRDPKHLILDANGIYYSGNAFGGDEDEELYDLQNTSDEGYVGVGYTKSFGSINEDLYIIKYDSAAYFGGDLIGISESNTIVKNKIKIFPTLITSDNPILNIQSDLEFSISLIDIYGKELIQTAKKDSSTNSIDLKNLSAGIYFLKVDQGGKLACFKLIKAN
ncbi:MAG: T9SS type A sorting domain-containing protein [Bacteroidota bacterium]|nr:T9SS type A sorting domain-containing protein [Bacteroidota bacterium]